ncbi:MAG TPA: type II toxin-antitoxin system RelE/ParE family toxin [Tepidisphaeraceae bacterium]|jgi:toxin ParE1/3/4
MKYDLRILPAADADVDNAAAFIARNSIASALRFYDAVDRTYRLIRDNPERWPRYEMNHPRLVNLRKCIVGGAFGKYIVFYIVTGKVIKVIRVLHGARDVPTLLNSELL